MWGGSSPELLGWNLQVPGVAETPATLGDFRAETPPPSKSSPCLFTDRQGAEHPRRFGAESLILAHRAETLVTLGESRAETLPQQISPQACQHTDKGRNSPGCFGMEFLFHVPGRGLRLAWVIPWQRLRPPDICLGTKGGSSGLVELATVRILAAHV